jgi:hypothetical protein
MPGCRRLLSCLLVACFLSACAGAGPRPEPGAPEAAAVPGLIDRAFTGFVFRDEFSAVLSRVIATCRDGSGDWKGDMQGDATAFAPMLLYDLSQDFSWPGLAAMADRTVAYEARRVRRCFYLPWPDMEVVIGIPALAQPFLKNNDDTYSGLFLKCVRIGYRCVSLSPVFLTPFVKDRASAYGLTSCMCFTAAQLSRSREERDSFVRRGVSLIEKADSECWDPGESMYKYDTLADWPQQTMMMALVRAYHATGRTAFLDRAIVVLGSVERRFLDREGGGYFGTRTLGPRGSPQQQHGMGS